MASKDFICTVCPVGCHLHVTEENGVVSVSGNTCKRGEAYGKSEYTDPQRTVTTSVFVEGGHVPVVSVRTAKPVSKTMIQKVLIATQGFVAQAPLEVGQVLIPDIAGTGVDMVATRKIFKA